MLWKPPVASGYRRRYGSLVPAARPVETERRSLESYEGRTCAPDPPG